ncbi:MAG: hypothetical protein H7Y18_03365 [Clostridiaceae bacterium]|nr:hypothetical protein [Clostridiaceae bacterium]
MKATKFSIIILTIIISLYFVMPAEISAKVYPGDNLIINISNIPSSITRLSAVLTNESNSIKLTIPYDCSGNLIESFTVPAGQNYTLKVIGYKEGGTFPSVLAGGKASNLNIVEDQSLDVNLTLTKPTIEVDSSTPTQVKTSEKFTIKLNITDPADFLQDVSGARIWWNTIIPSTNTTGSQPSGTLTRIGEGQYVYTIQLTATSAPGKMYYQFGESSYNFQSPLGNEAPFLVLPDYSKGEPPFSINVVKGNPDINLHMDKIPSGITKLFAVLENGSTAIKIEIPANGSETQDATFFIPSGQDYTLKVIGYKEGGTFPSVLAGGKVSNLNIVEDQSLDVNLTLTKPTVEVDPSTPTQVKTSEKFTIKLNITDPADFLQDVSGARIWWNTIIPSTNTTGSQPSGTLTRIEEGQYVYTIQLTAISAPGKMYYQFGESSYKFQSPLGNEAPFLMLPDYSSGQLPFSISVFRTRDINNDGNVDIVDLAKTASYYAYTLSSNSWNENADINDDGSIDIYDLVLISKDIK